MTWCISTGERIYCVSVRPQRERSGPAVLWFLWRKMLSGVEKSQKWVSSPMERLPTFKSFIKLQKLELILATAYNKNTALNNWKGGKKRKYEEGEDGKREKNRPDRSIFIFLCSRYHLKGFLITTTRQKLLGFIPDPLNDKISSHSLCRLISVKHLGASSPKYMPLNVEMPFGDAGVTFDKKLLD